MSITRGIAALALALALALVGVVGGSADSSGGESTEVAGGTWS